MFRRTAFSLLPRVATMPLPRFSTTAAAFAVAPLLIDPVRFASTSKAKAKAPVAKSKKAAASPKKKKQPLQKSQRQNLEEEQEGEEEDEELDEREMMMLQQQMQQQPKALMRRANDEECADGGEEGEGEGDEYPNVLLVQLCDHMQHDQGVKRHAVTVTFGADGFRLNTMCRDVRADLKKQLAASYWQMHQTQERSAFFVCTRISYGTADLLITSMTQRVMGHVEKFGYRLASSYVTLSPDVQHTSVRMMYHYLVFRRIDDVAMLQPQQQQQQQQQLGAVDSMVAQRQQQQMMMMRHHPLQQGDGDDDDDDDDDDEEDEEDEDEAVDDGDAEYIKGRPEYRNFEPPAVGPQEPTPPPKRVPRTQQIKKIWDDEE